MTQKPVRRRNAPVSTPRPGHGWEDVVEAYLLAKRRQGLSPATLEGYRGHLLGERAQRFVVDHHVTAVADVTQATLEAFFAELQDAGLGAGNLQTIRVRVKGFLRWARANGYGAQDVTALTGPSVNVDRTETAVLSREDERRVLHACHSDRDRFMVRFMIATGVRRQDVIAARLSDIRPVGAGQVLHVHGKGRQGGVDRLVPLGTRLDPMLYADLKLYVKTTRAKFHPTTDHIFTTDEGTQLSRWAVSSIFRRLARDSGVPVHPHMTRHTAATRWIQDGVSPHAVQRALGHTTQRMVGRYVHFDGASLSAAFNN